MIPLLELTSPLCLVDLRTPCLVIRLGQGRKKLCGSAYVGAKAVETFLPIIQRELRKEASRDRTAEKKEKTLQKDEELKPQAALA